MREAWYAVLLSYFVPGLGHLFAGRPVRGAIFLVAFAGLLTSSFYLVLAPGADPSGALGTIPLAMAIYLVAMVDTYRTARRAGDDAGGQPATQGGGKDPWLAGFLSYVLPGLFLPGVGQIYGRKTVAGIVFIVAGSAIGWLVQTGRLVTWGFPALHAVRIAALWHAQATVGRARSAFSRRFLWLVPLILAEAAIPLVVGWVVRDVITVHQVRGSGMHPEYRGKERVLVHLGSSRRGRPERGDVVLYDDAGEARLARVVVLPGEMVEVRRGKMLVKGEPVSQLVHPIPEGDWGTLSVPQGKVILLPDRARLDPAQGLPSPIEIEKILGLAYKRIYPLERPEEGRPTPGAPTGTIPETPPPSGD